MAFVEWNERFSVEVDTLDRQHQQMFAMINELHGALIAREAEMVAPHILQRLAEYTLQHFLTEEMLLQEAGYADFEQHKKEHEVLANEVLAWGDYFDHRKVMGLTLLTFLKEWLENHILHSDLRYRPTMRASGIV